MVQTFIDVRNELGWDQGDLAEKADVRPATISDFEAGKTWGSIQLMWTLAQLLNVRIGYRSPHLEDD